MKGPGVVWIRGWPLEPARPAPRASRVSISTTPGTLNNDFFVNLLDMATTWELNAADASVYDGKSLATGETTWSASQCDLVFGSNSELRAIAEHYGMGDMSETFCADFAAVFGKVMNNDRFDLA